VVRVTVYFGPDMELISETFNAPIKEIQKQVRDQLGKLATKHSLFIMDESRILMVPTGWIRALRVTEIDEPDSRETGDGKPTIIERKQPLDADDIRRIIREEINQLPYGYWTPPDWTVTVNQVDGPSKTNGEY